MRPIFRPAAHKGRRRATAIIAVLLPILVGCASPFSPLESSTPPTRATHVAVEFVPQDTQSNCGAAALVSVMRYWGVPGSLRSLKETAPPAQETGYTIGELVSMAREQQLKAFAFAMPEKFAKLQIDHGRPLIVPIAKPTVWAQLASLPVVGGLYVAATGGEGLALSHYVVIVGYDEANYYLIDPAEGYRQIRQADFNTMRAPFGHAGILVARDKTQDAQQEKEG